jgi:SAM-dependent methyltransferase
LLGEQEEAAPSFDRLHNHTKTGKYFDQFFQDVSRGKFGKSEVPFQPVVDLGHGANFHSELMRHTGHFDDHIAKSIPTYRETQVRKGFALAKGLGDGKLHMLDIGGSEGSFAKAITAYSGGNVTTKVVDPNTAMHEFFGAKSTVPGSTYDPKAFHKGWTNDDGSEVPGLHADNTQERFDIIHEAMVFQFINNDRATHVAEVKKLLKPGGLFVTEEKLKTTPEEWKHNEDFKDREYKNIYYSNQELAAKQKVVGFQQDKKDEKAVGMVDNMVSVVEFEKILLGHFVNVWQYWDSGNFKGYAASDDSGKISKFLSAAGDLNSKFSTIRTPRKVVRGVSEMKTWKEWLYESKDHHALVGLLVPDPDAVRKMSHKHARSEHGPKIKQAAQELDVELTDDDVEQILLSLMGPEEELPEFDPSHYHHHL